MSESNKGLMAFWSDIDPSYVDEYRRWHSEEHIPERISIPGFKTGQRYKKIEAVRMFFMYYDTTSPQVLSSDEYRHALNNPTDWTRKSLQFFKNPLRNLYRTLSERGVEPHAAAKTMLAARFDIPEHGPGNKPVTPADIAETLATEGAYRVRSFELDEAATAKPTAERSIYGAQTESQRYLALVEKNAAEAASNLPSLRVKLEAAGARNVVLELYDLDFGMRA
jgi:hypothetical protein